jgi:predicted DNA-binding transcriptional regulator AlpA
MRFLTYDGLKDKGVKYSKEHIWRLRQLPANDPRKFPDPVKGLGPEGAWPEDEIDAYISLQIAERNKSERSAPELGNEPSAIEQGRQEAKATKRSARREKVEA